MPEFTAARADRFSASVARAALALALALAALGIGAWIVHAPLPAWGWACVWPDAFALVLVLFLRALRTLDPRPDPRLARGRS
jgi:hypothetical protein